MDEWRRTAQAVVNAGAVHPASGWHPAGPDKTPAWPVSECRAGRDFYAIAAHFLKSGGVAQVAALAVVVLYIDLRVAPSVQY